MNILLSNDDGIDAPGLLALEVHLREAGWTVWVVAPDRERSVQSHALTLHHALRAEQRRAGRWAVSGTPADCVYLALHGLLPDHPDFVIAGINDGANLGNDVHYSGTVAAAREACMNGIGALSVSLLSRSSAKRNWDLAADVAVEVVRDLVDRGVPDGVHFNLNIPNGDSCNGVRRCGLGPRHYERVVSARTDPRGKPYYWIGGPPRPTEGGEGTDVYWVNQGFASLTPLAIDVTATAELEAIDDR